MPGTDSNDVNIIINGTSQPYDNLSSKFLENLENMAALHDWDVIVEVRNGPYTPAE